MLSNKLEMTLHRALSIANRYNHEFATVEHLLLSLTEDKDALLVLKGCKVNISRLTVNLKKFLKEELNALEKDGKFDSKPTAGFQRVVHRAAIHVHALKKNEINGANILAEIFSEQGSYAVLFLKELKITKEQVLNFISNNVLSSESNLAHHASKIRLENNVNPKNKEESVLFAEENNKKSILSKFTVNLNKLALQKKINALVGRENEINRTIEVLCRRCKNNPIFVGEPGVGKTAIVEGLALCIANNNIPKALQGATIYALDMGSLVAGTRYRGDFEERVRDLIKEIQEIPSAILFIDEIHTIIGAGSTNGSALDAGNLLKPALARGTIRCIGSTTFDEYTKYFEKDQALVRRFQKIIIDEPSKEVALKMLEGLKSFFEEHHQVTYTKNALKSAVKLSNRYMYDRRLPDKAIDIIDETGARIKLTKDEDEKRIIDSSDIEETVSRIVRIPVATLSQKEEDRLFSLEKRLKSKLFGQDEAIHELVAAIKLSHAGLRRDNRPKGCYLFVGPTGVGKTELAKQLAFETRMNLSRFDMSEYMESHSVSKLIGTPPGYVGFEQGGMFTEEVRKNPYSIILLDEIEKAHPDIFNIMLQVMDYGKATDSNNREINFTNSIIIMTSNIGASEEEKSGLGFARDSSVIDSFDAVNKSFSPEFRNRLDAIVKFKPIGNGIVKKIVDKFINQLKASLADKNTKLCVTNAAKKYLCKKGYTKNYGARGLERILDQKISKYIADEILFGKLKKGGQVNIDLKNESEGLTFEFESDIVKVV